MGLFTKKRLTSDEYSDLSAKIVKLSTEVLILQNSVEKFEMRLKGYHTKLARVEKEEQEEEQEEEIDAATQQRRLLGLP